MRRGTSGINALVAVDKPRGMSSHDVVNRVRRAVGEGRVGHAGTLDPDASGVLVVGIGQGARLLGMLTLEDKGYDASVEFGTETTTDDAQGEVVITAGVPDRLSDPVFAAAVVASLVGAHEQVPPSFSAISVDGRRAYARARVGERVELPARHVEVTSAELVGVRTDGGHLVWDCSFRVSKGCYVRSIARDLGRSMGTAAHLCGLRRTSSGPVGLDACVTLDDLANRGAGCVRSRCLDPVATLGLPVRSLSSREAEDVSCGRRIPAGMVGGSLGEGGQACLVHDGRLLGVWRLDRGWLACVSNFPGGIEGASS